ANQGCAGCRRSTNERKLGGTFQTTCVRRQGTGVGPIRGPNRNLRFQDPQTLPQDVYGVSLGRPRAISATSQSMSRIVDRMASSDSRSKTLNVDGSRET
ncbi:MAG: hypothetical protein AAGJ83_11580, partial [Planctomycetota bacterium]